MNIYKTFIIYTIYLSLIAIMYMHMHESKNKLLICYQKYLMMIVFVLSLLGGTSVYIIIQMTLCAIVAQKGINIRCCR